MPTWRAARCGIRVAVLRVAGAPGPVGDLDGPAVAAALGGIELRSVADGDVVAALAAASRLAAWAAGREVAATAELTARAGGWRGVGPLAAVVKPLLSA